jgi:hypothetical protein
LRRILIVLGLLVAVVLAVAIYLVVNIDSVVQSRIERTGTRVAGVPVTVGAVEISLSSGTATVTDLSIANPPGFSEQPAIHFGQISASVNVATGVITRVLAARPLIRVEGAPERTNIDVLRGKADTAKSTGQASGTGQSGSGESGDTTAESTGQSGASGQDDDEESSDTYEIRLIEIEQAALLVDLEGLDSPTQLDVERFAFTDLQGTRSVITRQLLDQLTVAIMDAVRERLLEIAGEALRSELESRADELEAKARERLKDLFD